jgi:hypothetical protein
MSTKLMAAKPVLMSMLGVQQSPVKSMAELFGVIATNAGPHIAQGIKDIVQGQVTIAMLNRGLDPTTGQILQKVGVQDGGRSEGFSGPRSTKKKAITKKPSTSMKKVEKTFEGIVIDVTAQQTEETSGEVFVDKIVELMLLSIKEDKTLKDAIVEEGDLEGLVKKMAEILNKIAAIKGQGAIDMAETIAVNMVSKFE